MMGAVDVARVLELYATGLFPMDEAGHDELPWWTADPRTVLGLDAASRERLRRKVRRSLQAGAAWELRRDEAFEEVLETCARPRHEADGVWISPRLAAVYRALHAGGHATSYEVWTDQGELAAGLVCVRVGRAAMLESMFHRVSHAGNVLLAHTLDALAADGATLCDVQLNTPHLERLGAVDVPRRVYEARLAAATGVRSRF